MAEQRNDYEEIAESLRGFAPALESLLREILIAEGVNFHYVRSRVKTKASTSRKLANPRKNYAGISDLTDLLGVRIVTYFPDEVDTVATLIKNEFNIDDINSVDKRQALAPDRFGYLSMHFIAELSTERSALAEYKRFSDVKFEIQVRSILQHAWAEIEHDLGYKSAVAVPSEIKRRFSRLAGLLELADQEFMGIREELKSYQEKVERAAATDYEDVPLDQESLYVFIKSPLCAEVDHKIANGINVPLEESSRSYAGWRLPEMNSAGFKTIGQVQEKMKELKEEVVKFSVTWLSAPRPGLFKASVSSETLANYVDEPANSLPEGISLFYLWLLLIAQGYIEDEDLHPKVLAELKKVHSALDHQDT